MTRLRSFYNTDYEFGYALPTNYKTENNRNMLSCSICADKVFVNDLIFGDVLRAIEKTLENPFVCEDCLCEYNEMAHQNQ